MKKVSISLIFLLYCCLSHAQVAGTTTSVSENFDYQENMTNVQLDPSPMIGAASEVSFIRTFATNQQPGIGLGDAVDLIGVGGVNIPGWLEDLAGGWNPFCFDFDPYIELGASIDAGGYYLVREVGNSDIDIDYPVGVTITYPEQNTFGCGYEIRIDTQYEVLEPNKMDKLKVTPPFINQEIGPKLQNLEFFAGIGLSAWYGIGIDNPIPELPDLCKRVHSFNESVRFEVGGPEIPTLPAVLNLCEEAYGPGANEASLLSCGVLSPAAPLLNIGQATLDLYNSTHGTNYSFASFPNEYEVKVFTPDIASGGPTLPEMGGTFKKVKNNELNFQALNGGKTLRVSGTKNAISEMSVDLVSFIDYSGYPTSLSLGGGLGSLDLGDVAPTFTVNQDMSFEFNPVINLNLDLGQSMIYGVYNSDDTLSHSGNGQIVALVAGQYILADFPYDLSDPLDVTGETFLDGTFETLSTQKYYQSINLKFAEVDIPGVLTGALIDETTPQQKFGENTILDHSFNLQPNNIIQLQGFTLDPEDPIVTISSLTVEDQINLGGGERAVVYKIGVRNDGDVKLNNTRVHFDLDTWFATATSYNVECITSDYFEVDTYFNGSSKINLLGADNSIEIGEEHFIEILVRVKPEISEVIANGCFGTVDYYVSSTAFATSPIGTEVMSNWDQCTEMITGPDIVEPIDLGASVISSLRDFAVYSTKSLVFSKGQQVSKGNAGSNGKIVFENVTMQNNPEAIIVGDLHSRNLINVIGHSDVIVDYVQTSSEINLIGNHSSFDVNGNISEYSGCASLPEIPALIMPNNQSRVKVTIPRNETLMLPPGDYKEIKLNENSTLKMQSGIYNIKDWHFVKDNATVEYTLNQAPIILNIQNWHATRNNLQFIVAEGSSTRDIYYNVGGNGSTHFNESLIQGNIFAPEGTIEFDNGSILEGNGYAETIKFKNNSGYAGHEFLVPLNISPTCQGVVIYRASVQQTASSSKDETMDKLANDIAKLNLMASPNPVQSSTAISFTFSEQQYVKVEVRNFFGKVIEVLAEKEFESGENQLFFNASYLPSGLYFYSITTASQGTISKQLIKE